MFPWELAGGEVMTLGAPDGGAGHESREGENTPLLAMLMPPSESWLVRRGATARGGLWGKVDDSGETSKGLVGLPGRRVGSAAMTSWGGPSARSGRATVGLGCATGEGCMVP